MKSTFSSAMMTPVIPIPPNLPVGYRFDPTDEELIGYYLVMLLHGFYSDDMPIGVVNFWELDPWELPGRSRIDSDDQVWYFFSKRVFHGDKKKRMFKRKTPGGHWKPTSESTNIDDLGKRSTLRFYKNSPKVEKTEWIAYEYEITQNSILPNPDEIVIIKLMNSSGEKRTKIKTKTSKRKSRLMSTSTNDQNQMASACEMMNIDSCNGNEVVLSDFENQNTVEMSPISTHDTGDPSSFKQQSGEAIVTVQPFERLINAVKSISPHALRAATDDISSAIRTIDRIPEPPPVNGTTVGAYCGLPTTASRETNVTEEPIDRLIRTEEELAYKMSPISTYETGEPSSRATSSCQSHSPITEVQEWGHFSMRLENQEEYEQSNYLFASDLENQKLPSEAADTPLKMTPCTENQLALDETNPSSSMTFRPVDDIQNEEFDLSFLEVDDFFSLSDLDVDDETNETFPEVDDGVLAALNEFNKPQYHPNPAATNRMG